MTTACGRPARNNYSVFATQEGQYGDKNYGYITPCETVAQCSSGYTAVPNTWCASATPGGNPVTSPACSIMQSQCVLGLNPNQVPTQNFVCQSNWSSPAYSANMVNCCSGLASSSDVCAPETCAASDPSTNNPSTGASGCHDTMLAFCTPDNWTSSSVSWQGLNIPGEVACDTYAKTVNSEVKVDGQHTSAQALIRNAIQTFYAPGSGNTPQTPHPFVQKAIVLARQNPGLVDDILTNVCSQYKRGDLVVGPKTPTDPNRTNLIQTCGCFLPASEYYTDPQTNVACDTLCAYPGAIPKGNGQGAALQCGGTTCVINNVAVDLLNSNGGSIDFSQVCGNCQSNGTSSGPCRCLFGDNSVSVIGNGSIAGVQVADKCGECFNMTQNSDGTFSLSKVDCGSIPPPTPSGGGTGIFGDIGKWITEHIALTVVIVVVLIVLITVIIVSIVYAEKKRQT